MSSKNKLVHNRNNIVSNRHNKIIAEYERTKNINLNTIDKERLDLRDSLKDLWHCESDHSPMSVKYLGRSVPGKNYTPRRRMTMTAPPVLQRQETPKNDNPVIPTRRCVTHQCFTYPPPTKLNGDFKTFYLSKKPTGYKDLVIRKSLLSTRQSNFELIRSRDRKIETAKYSSSRRSSDVSRTVHSPVHSPSNKQSGFIGMYVRKPSLDIPTRAGLVTKYEYCEKDMTEGMIREGQHRHIKHGFTDHEEKSNHDDTRDSPRRDGNADVTDVNHSQETSNHGDNNDTERRHGNVDVTRVNHPQETSNHDNNKDDNAGNYARETGSYGDENKTVRRHSYVKNDFSDTKIYNDKNIHDSKDAPLSPLKLTATRLQPLPVRINNFFIKIRPLLKNRAEFSQFTEDEI